MKLLIVNDAVLEAKTMSSDIPWTQYMIDEVHPAYLSRGFRICKRSCLAKLPGISASPGKIRGNRRMCTQHLYAPGKTSAGKAIAGIRKKLAERKRGALKHRRRKKAKRNRRRMYTIYYAEYWK